MEYLQLADLGIRAGIVMTAAVGIFTILTFVLMIIHVTRSRKIVMYGSENCKHCRRAKEEFTQHGLNGSLKYIEVSKSPGKEQFKKLRNVRGVPHFVSDRTGKSHTGYEDPRKLVKDLL